MDMYVYDNIGRMVEITETLEELEKLRIKYRNKNIGWRFLKACSLTFIILGGTYGYFPYSFLGFIPLIITTRKSIQFRSLLGMESVVRRLNNIGVKNLKVGGLLGRLG